MASIKLTSHKVAVIGAGPAGLVAARELLREGHEVVVFERESQLGGTWIYSPKFESDLIGLDPKRKVIHSSLYNSLRTNLPREVMGFRDFPFVPTGDSGRDPRRFPNHEEMLCYLQDFAHKFKLNELVRYQTEVKHVALENGKFKVSFTTERGNVSEADETFDAVVVCNGHFTVPRIAQVPGVEKWPGKQTHSHNYRVPESYRNQVVVVIGNSFSAADISIELAAVAKEVHIASRSSSMEAFGNHPCYENMWLHPMIASANEDGTVKFEDGRTIFANAILHCTGYKYDFPFLHMNDPVTVDDNRVGPLYKHVFPPGLAPWLSFVGVTSKFIPFPQFELQSKWIASVLSGRVSLPPVQEMMVDVETFYSRLNEEGVPKRFTHFLGELQFEYNDWLATQCGSVGTEEWRKQMFLSLPKMRADRPLTFRDDWNDKWIDGSLISEAHSDFVKYLKENVK